MEQKIIEVFLERKRKNPQYSLSAFSRDLGCSVSFLSRLMRGERRLTTNQILKFQAILKLDQKEVGHWLKGAVIKAQKKGPSQSPDPTLLHADQFRMISNWIHYAILNLIFLKDFKPNVTWVSRRLGVHPLEVQDAVDRMVRMGLLQVTKEKWIRTDARLRFESRTTDTALREFHIQHFEKAIQNLRDPKDFERRYVEGLTVPISKARIPKLKEKISKTMKIFLKEIDGKDCDEVYHLSFQMIPLTERQKEE